MNITTVRIEKPDAVNLVLGQAHFIKNVEEIQEALAVDDIARTFDELRRQSVAVVDGPTDFTVCWSAEIHDPDGNALLIHHRADDSSGIQPG